MEMFKAYQEFNSTNSIKKEKWQPDALIIVPSTARILINDIKNTFHSREIKSAQDGPGILITNKSTNIVLPHGYERPVINVTDPSDSSQNNLSSREIFQDLSQKFLKRGTLAQSFFKFADVCKEQKVNYAAIAGACTYYYWGGWPIYDIDVVVPNHDHLKRLQAVYGGEVYESESGIGKMKYLNLGDIDALTDLELKYSDGESTHRREFTFDELVGEGNKQRLFGETINLADPLATVILKLYLGRFGIDPWGMPKDDYEDGLGTMVSQGISWSSLEARAHQMGISNRVQLGKAIFKAFY